MECSLRETSSCFKRVHERRSSPETMNLEALSIEKYRDYWMKHSSSAERCRYGLNIRETLPDESSLGCSTPDQQDVNYRITPKHESSTQLSCRTCFLHDIPSLPFFASRSSASSALHLALRDNGPGSS